MTKAVKKTPKAALKGRDKLILVAMQLFADRGFDGVTVRDIAKAADVSIGLINHHFESKEGLRAAVDAHFLAETSKAIARATKTLTTNDLEAVGEYHRTWIREYEAEWPSFAAYLRRAITENNEWGENLFREYYDSVARMITRYDADGKIADDADRLWLPLLYSFMLVGPLLLDPYIRNMLGKSTYDPEMWGRFQRALKQLFWNGASPRKL
jgi:AcrR family transcriptional regulator